MRTPVNMESWNDSGLLVSRSCSVSGFRVIQWQSLSKLKGLPLITADPVVTPDRFVTTLTVRLIPYPVGFPSMRSEINSLWVDDAEQVTYLLLCLVFRHCGLQDQSFDDPSSG
jgi:hypothetical protein